MFYCIFRLLFILIKLLFNSSSSTPMQLMNVANSGTCAVRLFATPEENVPLTPSSLGIATLSSLPSTKVKKNSR